jgi:hypothetical protein
MVLAMNDEVIIVSGLPRSGTSLMMQMLTSGGILPLIDNFREADTDNPRGYYEFERVKKIKEDKDWLPEARGKVVKMVSQLLLDLPATENYRVVFMDRDLDEMIVSQEKMLARRNREPAPRDEIKKAFTNHLDRLNQWLATQPHIKILHILYSDLMADPDAEIQKIVAFLDHKVDPVKMLGAIDPTLYRNRKEATN